MRFGESVLRFRLGPTLLLACPALVCVALGFWQLDRAEQKRAEARLASERAEEPPMPIAALVSDPQGLRYRQVRVDGYLDPERQLFIEGRREGGRNGLHVITPLRIAGSEIRVLVNRGWLPDPGHGIPPSVETPTEKVTAWGEVHLPSAPALVLQQTQDGFAAWGPRWPYLTVALFAAGAPYPVEPFVILLDPEAPFGFQRHWPKELPKEEMHLGYAIQWFAFALIALVLYLRLSLARRQEMGDD